MKDYIAYCGLDCEACEARQATLNDDDDLPSFESFDEVASKAFSDVDKADGKGEFNFDDLAQSAGDSDSSWG